ncbi:MAG: hypothetical protein JNK45_27395 [Myxococcales bacterium]|nr:hypothetical protein [Myxococcales bacterium]
MVLAASVAAILAASPHVATATAHVDAPRAGPAAPSNRDYDGPRAVAAPVPPDPPPPASRPCLLDPPREGRTRIPERRRRFGEVYAGLAAGTWAIGLGIAARRWWTTRCPSYATIGDDCGDVEDEFFAVLQTVANLHALAFAGASSGMFGRRAHDSRRSRVRQVVAGTTSLTLGAAFGVTAYVLPLVASPSDIRGYTRLWAGEIAIAEVGGLAAIAGTVLLARVVSQRRVARRRRVELDLAPGRTGAGFTLRGRF